jgi:hypothetical protein
MTERHADAATVTSQKERQPRKRQSEKVAALLYLADRTNRDLSHVATELGLSRSDCVEIALGEFLAKHAALIRRV